MSTVTELAGVLEYLQSLGWEEVYLPAGAAGASAAPRPASGAAAVGPARSAAAATTARSGLAVAGGISSGMVLTVAERAVALAAVAAEAAVCTRCSLAATRRTVVFGSGDADADLMFIGEGPGAEEDRQGLPFVGPAGQLLSRIIGAIGLTREQVYIANVVKCRPPANRDPRPEEVSACRGYLESQIRLVQPRAIVALGRIAAQTLLGNDLAVGKMRGCWHRLFDVPLRVTYHPAAILRNEALRRPTWEDMQAVRDHLRGD